MGKVFIEYETNYNDNIEIYLEEINSYFYCIIDYARSYIETTSFEENIVEETLLTVINDPIINIFGIPLEKGQLNKKRTTFKNLDSNRLINHLFSLCAWELFNNENPNKDININLKINILLDFLNFVSKLNEYDKVFTLTDLYNKAKREKMLCDLENLKHFLEDTVKYSKYIKNGMKIEEIINKELRRYNIDLEKIDIELLKHNKRIQETIEIIIYSYVKTPSSKKKEIESDLIKQKLLQMQKRDDK